MDPLEAILEILNASFAGQELKLKHIRRIAEEENPDCVHREFFEELHEALDNMHENA